MKDKELKLAVVVEGESMLCRLLITFSAEIEIDVLVSGIHLSFCLASWSISPTHYPVPRDRASVRMHKGIASTNLPTSFETEDRRSTENGTNPQIA